MMEAVKGIIDKRLEKYLSRKLLVWLTTTGLLLADKVTNEQWVAIALAYVGIQGFADIAIKWKSGK